MLIFNLSVCLCLLLVLFCFSFFCVSLFLCRLVVLVSHINPLGSRCSVAAPRLGGLRLLSCAFSRYFLHFSSLSAKHSDDGKRASHGSADGAP